MASINVVDTDCRTTIGRPIRTDRFNPLDGVCRPASRRASRLIDQLPFYSFLFLYLSFSLFFLLFDYLIRYATPCFLLGSFIGLVAIVVALGGRCTGPDRTLICSSLHILAGNKKQRQRIESTIFPIEGLSFWGRQRQETQEDMMTKKWSMD